MSGVDVVRDIATVADFLLRQGDDGAAYTLDQVGPVLAELIASCVEVNNAREAYVLAMSEPGFYASHPKATRFASAVLRHEDALSRATGGEA